MVVEISMDLGLRAAAEEWRGDWALGMTTREMKMSSECDHQLSVFQEVPKNIQRPFYIKNKGPKYLIGCILYIKLTTVKLIQHPLLKYQVSFSMY